MFRGLRGSHGLALIDKQRESRRPALADRPQERGRSALAAKLRADRGLTLVEMLCAALILFLLALLLNTGLHMAVNTYRGMVLQSEMRLLLSTLSDVLVDDLHYASAVETESDTSLKEYRSVQYGEHTKLNVNEDAGSKNFGQLYVDIPNSETSPPAIRYALLPDGAYGGVTWVCGVPPGGLDIRYNEATQLFTVTLEVQEMRMTATGGREFVPSGGLKLETTFSVRCQNQN